MISRTNQLSQPAHQAFSLMEMLIVVAVIGIMAAVAIAFLGGGHRESMTRIRDQRNAQEVVSLTMGATAVGADVIEPGDMKTTIQNLMEGRQAASGAFAGRTFRLSTLNEEEIAGALKYLTWRGNQPVYVFGGN